MCIGSLKGSLWLQLSLPGKQKPSCFSQLDIIWVTSWLWFCRLGSPSWSLDPTLLRENPWATEFPSNISGATYGNPASPLLSPPHSIPVMLWWSNLFHLSMIIRLLSSYFSIGFPRIFLYNLVVIPDWSWEEVNLNSAYSSAILDLLILWLLLLLLSPPYE